MLVCVILCLFVAGVVFLRIQQNSDANLVLSNQESQTDRLFKRFVEFRGRSLYMLSYDYTYWDEMVHFAESGDPVWAKENIEAALATYDAHVAWVLDPDFRIVNRTTSGSDEGECGLEPPPTETLRLLFGKGHFVHFFTSTSEGWLEIRGASIHPTSDEARKTPPRGYFIVGRLWSKAHLDELASLFDGTVHVLPAAEGKELTPGSRGVGGVLLKEALEGPDGTPVAFLVLEVHSEAIARFLRTMDFAFYTRLIYSITILILCSWLLTRWVSRPLKRVTLSLDRSDVSMLAPLMGESTEFGEIARLITQFFKQKEDLSREVARRGEAQEELARRADRLERYQSALLELAKLDKDIGSALRTITETVAKTMRVERVGIWLMNDPRTAIDCLDLYISSTSSHEVAPPICVNDYPCYFQAFEESRVIAVDDACSDPCTGELADKYLRPLGISSLLDVPIRLHGKTVGVVCHEHIGPRREWSIEEQSFAGSVADLVSLLLQSEERRKAEEAVYESEERFKAIFDSSNDAILLQDPVSARILEANSRAQEMFGFTPDEFSAFLEKGGESSVPGYSYADIVQKVRQAFREGSLRFEWLSPHRDGHSIWVEVNLKRVTIAESEYVLANVRDIGNRKKNEEERAQLEEQLRQSQKMESIGRLAGGVAHDFNNLLSPIMGYADLILSEISEGHPFFPELQQIREAAGRAANLSRQLLAFSRRQVLDMRVLNLNAVIGDFEKMLRRLIGEDIELVTHLDPGLGNIRADHSLIEQLIMNLAVNARDAMPSGGKLTIETANVKLDEAYARLHASVIPGRYVLLSVSDNGHGMDEATMSRAFEPFFTTKASGKGTGLGLATCYGVAKQHGGNIWVYSEMGHGTTFKVYLPRVGDDVTSETPSGASPAEDKGAETILIAEDEASVRDLVINVLRGRGYTVLAADSPEKAVELAEGHAGHIHMLLTDVIMPRMNGRELYDRVAERRPGIKVMYMSGYTADVIVNHGVLEPGTHFLQKPFSTRAIATKVRETLDA